MYESTILYRPTVHLTKYVNLRNVVFAIPQMDHKFIFRYIISPNRHIMFSKRLFWLNMNYSMNFARSSSWVGWICMLMTWTQQLIQCAFADNPGWKDSVFLLHKGADLSGTWQDGESFAAESVKVRSKVPRERTWSYHKVRIYTHRCYMFDTIVCMCECVRT